VSLHSEGRREKRSAVGSARSEAFKVLFGASTSVSASPDYGSAACSDGSVACDYHSAERRNWSARSSSESAVIEHYPGPSKAQTAVYGSASGPCQKQFASTGSPVVSNDSGPARLSSESVATHSGLAVRCSLVVLRRTHSDPSDSSSGSPDSAPDQPEVRVAPSQSEAAVNNSILESSSACVTRSSLCLTH
jgi:hypothetical protein